MLGSVWQAITLLILAIVALFIAGIMIKEIFFKKDEGLNSGRLRPPESAPPSRPFSQSGTEPPKDMKLAAYVAASMNMTEEQVIKAIKAGAIQGKEVDGHWYVVAKDD